MRLPVWSVWQDVRFGARVLLRDRGFTLAAVLLLGLGLGVNTTVFTIVNAVNLRGLPVERADQILQINVIGTLLTVFALVATMLSALGLYAVTSYGMSQRTAEIGLRMARGPRRSPGCSCGAR